MKNKGKVMATLLFGFVFFLTTVCSASDGGPLSETRASRQTMFNSVTDFFATVGKSKERRQTITTQRKALRKQRRLVAAMQKRQVILDRQLKTLNKEMMDAAKKNPFWYKPEAEDDQKK